MRKLINDILTGKDNITNDFVKVWTSVSLLAHIGATFYEIYRNSHWDPIGFSVGVTSILGVASLAVRVKQSTEPGTSNSFSVNDSNTKDNNNNDTYTK